MARLDQLRVVWCVVRDGFSSRIRAERACHGNVWRRSYDPCLPRALGFQQTPASHTDPRER